VDESLRATARQFDQGKKRRVLSTQRIIFLVVAAAAPLAAMIGNLPIALARGNGAGTPAAFLFAGVTLICFAVGYAAMSRRVVNTGAFYTYVAKGLGKRAGLGAAYTAVVAYVSFTIGLAAFFGYFLHLVLSELNIHFSWLLYAAGGMVAVAILGYRSIDLSSKILGVLMAAEVAILAIFDVSVIAAKGAAAFPLESFAPSVVMAPGLGAGLMVAFTSFIGFESAALYGEESKTPTTSVPIATYTSVFLIAAFYLLTSWVTVGALGAGTAASAAAEQTGLLMFNLMAKFSGKSVSDLMGVFVCTSLLATYLAIHNAASRYVFALSREKLLPVALGRLNRFAPSNASIAVTITTIVCVAAFGMTGVDPYKSGVPVLIGFGTLGIIFLQGFAAVAIVFYLGQRRREIKPMVLVASALGAIGLALATVLVAAKFRLLSTSDLPGVEWLPLIYVATVAFGIGFAFWLRRHKPRTFSALAESDLRADSARPLPRIHYDGKYCIVGAGPCGLLAARAFKLAGIPYDQFERHSDVGGIWDIDNPGSSMYESAHFISSKYTSSFFGLPMPKDYPDYPDHRQLLRYIRDFTDAFELRAGIRFNTSVKHAEPLGENAIDGWRVTLSSGEIAVYKGLICANGVTWHPNLPSYPGLEEFKGEVRHTVEYRSPDSLAGRRVLIVGAGNSGVDIACDAARGAARAFISLRRGYHFVPKHMFGVPTDVFLSGQVTLPKGVAVPDDPSKMLSALVGDLTRYGLPAPDHKALESHPIMNTQILHYLAHGDLQAKGDIQNFTAAGVRFVDGSVEDIDLILFATGYEYRIPYIDPALFTWKQGHPELYLNIFHRRLQGLSVVGFVEFASAGYQRFDEMAQMAAMDAYIRQSGVGAEEWSALKANDRPNLRGTVNYIDSPRHANYVEVSVYRRTLAGLREKFAWPDPDNHLYEVLHRKPA
jgi:cation diffusion facilitator CzcD-associated flavoprotein CzcO/amino acid transporter